MNLNLPFERKQISDSFQKQLFYIQIYVDMYVHIHTQTHLYLSYVYVLSMFSIFLYSRYIIGKNLKKETKLKIFKYQSILPWIDPANEKKEKNSFR